MTVTELLAYIDAKYPNAETAASKISFMNVAQDILSPYFGKIVEDSTTVTVVDQDSYAFPTGLTGVEEIVSLAVSNQATPDGRYDYKEYVLARPEHNPMQEYSYHEIVSDSGAKKLVLYPIPDTVGLHILIRFKNPLTVLSASALTESPDFNSRYHIALAFYAISEVCSSGSSPDGYQADYYMQKFDTTLDNLWKFTNETDKKLKRKTTDNPQWHSYKSYGAGFEDVDGPLE
jgi:hypothetical protein